MIEFNKRTCKIILMLFYLLSLFSCKSASLVNYESINYENFQKGTLNIPVMTNDDLYFTRIMTATSSTICFFRYSEKKDIQDINIKNLKIKDEYENLIYEKQMIIPETTGLIHNENNFYYKIFSFDIDPAELDRQILKNYKTNFIILEFEINGKHLSDKLKKIEKKYIVTPT